MNTVYKRMIKITYNQTTTTNNKTTQLTCTTKLPLSTNGKGDTPFNVQHHAYPEQPITPLEQIRPTLIVWDLKRDTSCWVLVCLY